MIPFETTNSPFNINNNPFSLLRSLYLYRPLEPDDLLVNCIFKRIIQCLKSPLKLFGRCNDLIKIYEVQTLNIIINDISGLRLCAITQYDNLSSLIVGCFSKRSDAARREKSLNMRTIRHVFFFSIGNSSEITYSHSNLQISTHC